MTVTVMAQVEAIYWRARELLESVKEERDTISVQQARMVASKTREIEGWLQSVRSALRSEGGI